MITLVSSPKQHLPKHMQHSVYIFFLIKMRLKSYQSLILDRANMNKVKMDVHEDKNAR